jgi:hypothetical protein
MSHLQLNGPLGPISCRLPLQLAVWFSLEPPNIIKICSEYGIKTMYQRQLTWSLTVDMLATSSSSWSSSSARTSAAFCASHRACLFNSNSHSTALMLSSLSYICFNMSAFSFASHSAFKRTISSIFFLSSSIFFFSTSSDTC